MIFLYVSIALNSITVPCPTAVPVSLCITSDAKDRAKIRNKILTCIDPLDPNGHSADLVNVVNGLISPETVNAHDIVDIGNGQLVSFRTAPLTLTKITPLKKLQET